MDHSRNNYIGSDKQSTLQVITPAVQDEEIDHESGDKKGYRFEEGEVQSHFLVHAPAQDHH